MNFFNSLWHQLSPWLLFQDETLQAIAAYLNEPATRAQLEALERNREYPQVIRQELHALGVSRFFAEPATIAVGSEDRSIESKVTIVHVCALNQIIAAINTSLAITIGVNSLALLPVCIAADQKQLAWVFDRVRSGAFAAMLLTEIENGSNLLRNQTQAEVGILEASGQFRAWSTVVSGKEMPTHYRLSGQKDLINGGSKHEILVVFARTRQSDISEFNPLSDRSDFSFFIVERDLSVTSPQRWQTVPVPAADITSVQFCDTLVPTDRRIGREGSGFSLVQKTLAISRGGISALAAGLASRAVSLATTYAQERRIYGYPILKLEAIADHLLRMQALELLISVMSLKATATLNYSGFGAVHYGAVAKYACCVLTEELVTEGRYLLGSRSLLTDHPYHWLDPDAALLSTFDGTTHVVLDQIQWRLEQLAVTDRTEQACWPDLMATIYQTPPQSLVTVTRTRSSSLLIPPLAYLLQLENIPGEIPLQPLIALSQGILALTRHCRKVNIWQGDQGLRFEAGKLLAYLETLVALVELADPLRRQWFGLDSLSSINSLKPLLIFTYGWFGGQMAATLHTLMRRVKLNDDTAELDQAERTFGRFFTEGRNIIRYDISLLTGDNR